MTTPNDKHDPATPVRIEVTEKFLETFGTGTLMGTVFNVAGGPANTVILVFHRTSLHWCVKHGGPHAIVMNDFVLPCLLDDVMRLIERGTAVSIEYVDKDPSS